MTENWDWDISRRCEVCGEMVPAGQRYVDLDLQKSGHQVCLENWKALVEMPARDGGGWTYLTTEAQRHREERNL